MSWADEICVSCGICCTTLSIVRVTDDDMQRLMRGYKLTKDQAYAMVRRSSDELTILMENTAACPALSSKNGRYLCNAYRHRPGICREYECYILSCAKDWLKQKSQNLPVNERNAFHSATSETELAQKVHEHIRTMRTSHLELCIKHENDTSGFRKPDYVSKLIELLALGDFENTFPPPALSS